MQAQRLTLLRLVMTALVCCPGTALAEEIILTNGQKIVGTIVGYENSMFRVETDYGVALVRKDRVSTIQIAKPSDATGKQDTTKPGGEKAVAAAPTPAGEGKNLPAAPEHPGASPAAASPSNAKTETPAHVVPSSPGAAPTPAAPVTPERNPPPNLRAGAKPVAEKSAVMNAPAVTDTAAIKPAVDNKASAPPNVPAPPPPSRPLDVPLPAHIEEHLAGSNYVNETFQFAMYKPPDWVTYEGVTKETDSGIMAMGTEDEQTLLFVDRVVWSGAPNLGSNLIEGRLRQTYQEYRKISETPFQCDGLPAIRRTFTGIVDGVEWHGIAVHVAQGNVLFGLIGLTSAETFEFQQSVFSKIIKSFHFLGAPSPPATAPPTGRP